MRHNDHEFFSMPVHTYGVQQGLCRTSRSVCSPVSHAPHRTCRPLAWDSRGRNTASLVFLTTSSPPFGHKESPAGLLSQGSSVLYPLFDIIIIAPASMECVHDITLHLPNNRTVRCCTARFFLLYADERSMWKWSQMSYTAPVLKSSSL